MIEAADVTACLVTRGDIDMTPILNSLEGFGEVIVWDNSEGEDLAVLGRYRAMENAIHDVIYCQDDDCVLAPESIERLLATYAPGRLAANMPRRFREHYPDSCLVGFGAIFDIGLPEHAFERYDRLLTREEKLPDATFNRTCDVVFTTLTARRLTDMPHTDLPYASDPNRMWKQPGHVAERQRTLELARLVRDRAAA